MKKYNKGFTLIELLVVIAIIGILAGIILVSLNTARGKANDAAVKANLAGVRSAMEIFYDEGSTYGNNITDCDSLGGDASTYVTGLPGGSVAACFADDQAYSISASMPSDNTVHWCVDSAGSNGTTSAATDDTTCIVGD